MKKVINKIAKKLKIKNIYFKKKVKSKYHYFKNPYSYVIPKGITIKPKKSITLNTGLDELINEIKE